MCCMQLHCAQRTAALESLELPAATSVTADDADRPADRQPERPARVSTALTHRDEMFHAVHGDLVG